MAESGVRDQSFEISVGAVKILELQVYDRQLVGKHDLIGTSTFKLDPRLFADYSTRDIVLPLNPRGTVHIRISMEGGEKHDVQYHLDAASRTCDRVAKDMVREIVDKMGEFIKAQLSVATLQTLTKPLKDKKRTKNALTEQEIEYSLGPLFEYLNENASIKRSVRSRQMLTSSSSPSSMLPSPSTPVSESCSPFGTASLK